MTTATVAPRPLVSLERETLSPERALETEWLETDGRGGYAAGTAAGVPTRRYHGLLVAPLPESAQRHLFLAGIELRLRTAAGEELEVSGVPDAFQLVPWPRATHDLGGVAVVCEVQMDRGRPTALCRFEVRTRDSLTLELTPRFACRSADALTFQNDALRPEVAQRGALLRFQPYPSLPPVTLRVDTPCEWIAAPHWQRGITYPVDVARGFDGVEDAFSPGRIRIELESGGALVVAASLLDDPGDPSLRWSARAAERTTSLAVRPLDLVRRQSLAAEDFLYRDAAGRLGILAGFPWFGEWGRDTFLSLPGLTLARGRVAEAWEVLGGALPFLRGGLLPNIFGATPEDSHYGSADAALWFVRAVRALEVTGGDRAAVRRTFAAALEEIAESYLAGAPLGLHFDEDLLLHAGGPELNPTWMDARVGERAVTPRHGAPVEIAALGYFLLAYLAEMRGSSAWVERRDRCGRTFLERLWLPEEARLADLWRAGWADRALRPNMVLAASLELSPLTPTQRGAVVDAAGPLLTPRGLRTLAPTERGYQGLYGGGPEERDAAYHQGTAWPWLLGPYVEASLRAGRGAPAERRRLRGLWEAFEGELSRGALNHLSEVFSGDEPHAPGGTCAQAWNTAELLRSLALLEQEGTS